MLITLNLFIDTEQLTKWLTINGSPANECLMALNMAISIKAYKIGVIVYYDQYQCIVKCKFSYRKKKSLTSSATILPSFVSETHIHLLIDRPHVVKQQADFSLH